MSKKRKKQKWSNETIVADAYEPDYEQQCDSCGTPGTVTAVKGGEVVADIGLCGVCTWGESAMRDPAKWNE